MLTESKRSYRSLIYSAGRNITEISIEEINEERERERAKVRKRAKIVPRYMSLSKKMIGDL